MPDMKVEKKPGSFYILGYLLELIVEIWRLEKKLFLKIGKFGLFFP
jgi:hypothetical protein